jgi:hypothetical protein
MVISWSTGIVPFSVFLFTGLDQLANFWRDTPAILVDGIKTAKTPSSQRETFAEYFKNLATPQDSQHFKDELLSNSTNRCNLIQDVSKNMTRKHLLTKLADSNIPDRPIVQISGHKNIASINSYAQMSRKRQNEISFPANLIVILGMRLDVKLIIILAHVSWPETCTIYIKRQDIYHLVTSARKHLLTKLADSNIPDRLIVQISGHKNIASIHSYAQMSRKRQNEI